MKKLSKSSYGTTPLSFERAMECALTERKNPVRPKRAALMVGLAVLLLALACTALAMSLQRSAQYSAITAAGEALCEQYGLTPETLDIFSQRAQEKDGQWIVRFTPKKYDEKAIGSYTVYVQADRSTEASWSNDGKPLAPNDGFDAAIWGQPQLEAALALDSAYWKQMQEIDWDSIEEWTLEERAELDAALAAAGNLAWVVHAAPEPDDIQEEEAIALAKDTFVKQYGITPEYLQGFSVNTTLLKYQDESEKQYRISLLRERKTDEWSESFFAHFSAQSGSILSIYWEIDPMFRSLPEGDLTEYETAVKEFMEEGAFDFVSAADKADIAARIQAAGYGKLLPYEAYAAPQAGDIGEVDAAKRAQWAMRETFGFTEETLALFQPALSLIVQDEERLWAVDYTPMSQESFRWYVGEQLGTYQVLLTADDGAVVSAEWSLMDEWPDEAYTETTWGQAPVLHASLLPWALELMAYDQQYLALYMASDWPDLSLEESAALDQLFRDRGFSVERYPHTLPGEDDISQEEALAIAKEVLITDFGIAENRIDSGGFFSSFTMEGPEHTLWNFRIWPSDNSGQEYFWVSLDARTGEVLYAVNDGVGNG